MRAGTLDDAIVIPSKGAAGDRNRMGWAGNAAASSLVCVALFGAAISLNYAVSGLVDWPIAGLFIVGGVAGGFLGLRGAKILAPGHRWRAACSPG